ncbi:major facilitator superfamily domain-containing protein [Lipomyces arxii]|uniref:major facilitator superfamily domain-containing protein n=1 Tax=Lipomyces arxii TaxID=56418 RepID=UPI0034CFE1F1
MVYETSNPLQGDSSSRESSNTTEEKFPVSSIEGGAVDEKGFLLYSDPEARPPVFKSTTHEVLTVIILLFATVMNTASSGAMQIAVPTLGRVFDVQGANLSWTVSSFSIISGSFILIFSGIADKFGRRRVVFVSYAWFALWSLISAFTTNHIVFDVCRGMQGLAAAACPSAGVGILGSTYLNGRRKNRIVAIFNAGAPIGVFLGTMTGGITIEFIDWRAIFFFYAIVWTILAALVFLVVPGDNINDNKKITFEEARIRLGELDLVGAALSICGLITFVLAAGQAGSASKGWGTPYVIVILIVSIALLATFIWWESRTSNPVMPLRIWKAQGFAMIMLTVLFSLMAFIGTIAFFSGLYFQNVVGASPLLSAVYYIPQIFTSFATVPIIAFTLHIVPNRLLAVISMLCELASALLWALMPLGTPYFAMAFPSLILVIISADLLFNVATKHTLSTVTGKQQSTAAGVFYTIHHVAGSFGISIGSSIVAYILRKEIALKAMMMEDAMNGMIEVSREMLAKAYNGAFWFAVGCSAAGVVTASLANVGKIKQSLTDSEDETSVLEHADNEITEESALLIRNVGALDYKSTYDEKAVYSS